MEENNTESLDKREVRNIIESSIIGAILIDSNQLPKVQAFINEDDFSNVFYRKVYLGGIHLSESGQAVDLLLMEALLQPEMPAVNVFSELAHIAYNTACAANAPLYAKKLKEMNTRSILADSLMTSIMDAKSEKPLEQIIEKAQDSLLAASATTTAANKGVELSQIAGDMINKLEESFEGQKELSLDTGYAKLDELLQGMRGGQLIILAARPSQGKSTLGLNILSNVIFKQKQRAVLVSLEMGSHEIVRSIIANMASVPLSLLKDDKIIGQEQYMSRLGWAMSQISEAKFHLYEDSSTIAKVKNSLREHKQTYPDLAFVMIDYLGLISKPKSENKNLEVSAITRELKLLSRELSIPILLLAQLNRNAETQGNRSPILSDLRDSGSIEQDADMVLFIHRHERDAKIIVGKNRSGACGDLMLTFDGATATFKEPYVQ